MSKENRVKRRKIYKDLDFELLKDKKTLDKETYKIGDKTVKSERLKNMEKLLKELREKGEIADFGVSDIADKLKTLAKGGEVKKYMGGGSVHKKKNKMLTTKGWGASRKT